MRKRMKGRSGFTLLELLIVVIIVGILASLALPRFFRGVERARWAEAKSNLGSLRGSQIRYYAEHGAYTAVLADLDVEIVATGRYFTFNPFTPAAVGDPIGMARRRSTQSAGFTDETVGIDEDGDFTYSAGVPAWLQ